MTIHEGKDFYVFAGCCFKSLDKTVEYARTYWPDMELNIIPIDPDAEAFWVESINLGNAKIK